VLWAWIFFGVALLPVMGFTDVGYMRHSLVADHYEHIALVGILGLVAAAAATGWQRISGLGRPALVVAAGAVVLTLTFLARQQSSLYANALTLYQNTLLNNPDSWLIQNNLGLEFYYAGQLDKAITHYQAALQLNPICALAYRNLGIAFADLNRLPEAIDCYQKALQIVPNYAEAHYNLGVALASVGRTTDAKEEYQLAVECKPDYPAAQHNLGLALAADGRFTEAISHFEQAVKADPDFVEAYVNLASAYAAIGQFDKAVNYAQRALELAHSQNQTKLADGIAARLKFYQERLSGAPEKTTTLDAGAAKP
jgi:tetratricopeptide (TPR) repeat protein